MAMDKVAHVFTAGILSNYSFQFHDLFDLLLQMKVCNFYTRSNTPSLDEPKNKGQIIMKRLCTSKWNDGNRDLYNICNPPW